MRTNQELSVQFRSLVVGVPPWHTKRMISVIIPTLNAQATLAATLSALVPACVEGLVREVILVDGGSSDATLAIADQSGAVIVAAPPGRGGQLKAGALRARFPWLMFLHADTILQPGFEREISHFMEQADTQMSPPSAACFRFALDDVGLKPRTVEFGVAVRTALLKLPYGDQGLLIPRSLYNEAGGFSDLPIMEDIEFMRRLGRSRIRLLNARAVTSAVRYRKDGYFARVVRNQSCLALFLFRAPPERIAKFYAGSRTPTL